VSEPRSILTTERLVLPPYRREDLDALFGILGDPETMQYYPAPYSREGTLAWITDNLQRYKRDGFGLWAIEDRATGDFLGNCGPAAREVEGVLEVELGWHVKRARWRQGIASEAAAACRDHCFDTLGLGRLISLVRPENVPSCRVAEKIGMAVEREIDWHDLRHRVYAVARGGR
jgi:RimJ/RimL family protein N-acetyltransferase